MVVTKRILLVSFLPMLLAGCATHRYLAAPISPKDTASRLAARTLADTGLQPYMEKKLDHAVTPWPPTTWDLRMLSLAALYFSPELDAARARVAEAEAATVTAGARPNPTLSAAPGVPSPYLFNLDFAVPIETAGKRGHRLQFARSLSQAAEFDLADTAWKVRGAVRGALLTYLLASRNGDLLRSEEELRQEQVRLLERRLAVGEIPRTDVDLARIELSKTHLATATADGQVSESRAALASSIGVPVAALTGVQFLWSDFDTPPSAESLSPTQIQADAVLNRLDVRRALAQYAAAEADVQLEISKQYPDLEIGPGYTYEERNNFFTIGISTTLPVFNRNQGPIAEAEARRKGAAAAFLGKQAQAIAESEQALALYTAALRELSEANQSLRTLQHTQLEMMRRAVGLGEEDRLSLNGTELQGSAIARARLDALARAQSALGGLEDAVQRPLDSGDIFPVSPESSPLTKLPKEPQR